MPLQKAFFVFVISFLLVPVCLAKKRKTRQYWKPSRFISSNSNPNFANQASETSAFQRILKSENQRIDKDPYLLQTVFHPSQQVAKSAILALGRIGDPYCVETLSRVLNGKNDGLKQLAAFSMGQIGDDLAIRLLSQHVAMERKPHIRSAFYRAMGYSRQLSVLSILTRALETETDSSVLKNVSEGIGILISGNSSDWIVSENTLKKLTILSAVQNSNSVAAAFALSQYKGDPKKLPVSEILSAATKTNNRDVQTLLIRVLSRVDDSQVVPFLLSQLSSSNPVHVRVEAIKSLRGHKLTDLGLGIFEKTLTDMNSHVTVAALETIDEQPLSFSSFSETILRTFKNTNSNWIKATALKTLSRVAPDQGRSLSLQALKAKDTLLISAALTSLIELNKNEDWIQIQPFLKQGSPQIVSQAIEALGNLKPGEISDDLKGTLRELIGKKDPGILALIAQLAGQKGWKDFADPLADTYYSLSAEDAVETRAAVIASLTAIGSENQIPVLSLALKDKSKQVVLAALEATKAITGKEIPFQIPTNSKVSEIVPDYAVWSPATSKKVILKTTRGDIEIKFYEDTPITAFRFVDLVKNHFYDGRIFHRVVPNFVSQGGDPRGDGFGGAGFLLRDEFSPRNHERGSLGIATSGKDTGGCQFFFNLLPNYQLNGRYTAFAEVVSGIEVMDRLELGDKIISATVK